MQSKILQFFDSDFFALLKFFLARKLLLVLLNVVAFFIQPSFSQNNPAFGNEIPVTVTGLYFDAMEPFISPDGNTLFFNSLNDGINTGLYYAAKVNDSTFSFVGQVSGVNQPAPHLDAVASMDYSNRFYWVSTRNYPSVFENLMVGDFSNGVATNIRRIYGNIYIFLPGWLIMDASIDYTGNFLFYCNAFFNNCASEIPCNSQLGISLKINDSTFVKLTQSDSLLQNVNDTGYLVYAPQSSPDLLELYFTRILKGTVQTEICVSARSNTSEIFSSPSVIYTNLPQFPEAPALTIDKSKLYYHKKTGSLYSIFLRYRTGTSGMVESGCAGIDIFPNPAANMLYVTIPEIIDKTKIKLYNITGHVVFSKTIESSSVVDVSGIQSGIYYLESCFENGIIYKKIIINRND